MRLPSHFRRGAGGEADLILAALACAFNKGKALTRK